MKRLTAAVVLAALSVAACGSTDDATPASPTGTSPTGTSPEVQSVAMPTRIAGDGDPSVAGASVTGFGFDLLTAASARADAGANVVVSPLSVAIALALLEPGTSGEGQTQLHELLGISDAATWRASMSALEQTLEAADAADQYGQLGDDEDPGELAINVADAAFLQPGYPFREDYLATIGTTYGPVVEELDFRADQQAAADRINDFIADATENRITDLVSADAIDPATVLALVNALLLKASWLETFDTANTVDQEFHRADGTDVSVPMMMHHGYRSGTGDGWIAAAKGLVGQLAVEFYLPDEGRLDDVTARFAEVATEFGNSENPGGLLGLPRFETRVNTDLTGVLPDLGLTAVFQQGSLLGVADDPRLVVDKVLHQAWVSFDEDGVEAAAATLILGYPVSAPIEPPIEVVLDRPFLFRIVDLSSDATLFIGRIVDPTA